MCQIDSDAHVESVYSKFSKAFHYMKHASIVNCADRRGRQKLYQEISTKVHDTYTVDYAILAMFIFFVGIFKFHL